jgi:hypothetical protein
MSENSKAPEQEPEKPGEPEKSTEEREELHPHRHGHVAIHPAETRVNHLDPGVVTF